MLKELNLFWHCERGPVDGKRNISVKLKIHKLKGNQNEGPNKRLKWNSGSCFSFLLFNLHAETESLKLNSTLTFMNCCSICIIFLSVPFTPDRVASLSVSFDLKEIFRFIFSSLSCFITLSVSFNSFFFLFARGKAFTIRSSPKLWTF